MIPVYLEIGSKKVFAAAFDWPGWCRAGKTQDQALAALSGARPRYASVAALGGYHLPEEDLEVQEQVAGSASTDFGVPGAVPPQDLAPITGADAQRLASLVSAAWTTLDQVVSQAPAELRKGPRGGGRDRDKIVDHVLSAEEAYAAHLGIRPSALAPDAGGRGSSLRRALLCVLGDEWDGKPFKEKGSWPPRYAARRIAWHVLDHAWEIEDRTLL